MTPIAYTYCVLRYLHDPAAGETLNVGVVLCAPAARYLQAALQHRYSRLSQAFVEFDGDHYQRTLRRFEAAVESARRSVLEKEGSLSERLPDLDSLQVLLCPDQGLSLQFGPVLAGLTDDPGETLAALFHRFVASQAPPLPSPETRTDAQVWSLYQRPLAQASVSQVLQPRAFAGPAWELQFKHTFKNDRWHVLQPVSFDYVKRESLQNKASRWLGYGVALQDHPEIGKLYLLLGSPQLAANRRAYNQAKDLLDKIPLPHVLVEEDEAEDFARELAHSLREHGVLPSDRQSDAVLEESAKDR